MRNIVVQIKRNIVVQIKPMPHSVMIGAFVICNVTYVCNDKEFVFRDKKCIPKMIYVPNF